MDRLLSLEPSNQVAIRVEPGQRCYGELTLRNVMYTMPVAFRLTPTNRNRYSIRPQSGIIAPLGTVTLELTYLLPLNSNLPDTVPACADTFLLDSVVVPGATFKNNKTSTSDAAAVPDDWFTARKKQVFTDSGIRIFFVGSAVLTKLVSDGHMDHVREVLEKSDPEWHAADSVDSVGQTLLHLAISRCRADIVQLILEFDPDIEARSRSGRTALETAAADGEELIAEILLARGASVDKSTASPWGPLHYSVAAGHSGVTKLLLLNGADPNSVTSDGRAPLHLAVAERRRDCVRMLLASGAATEARGGPDGHTALHVAAATGDEQMVRLLVTKGGAGLKEVRNYGGRTAYDVAAEGGHGKVFDVLRLADGLAAAARKGEARAAARAVERGAAVNGRDQHGWTALMRAAFKGRVEVMRALVERGAEVEARDGEGYTALHCAAEAGHAEAVEVLVKRGADVEARTQKGKTALQIARSFGYVGIERILVQGGAHTPPVDSMVALPKINGPAIGEKEGKMKMKKKKASRLSVGGGGGFDRAAMAVASH